MTSGRFTHNDQAQALLYHARSATPFCSDKGETFVSVPASIDSRRVFMLRSGAFQNWLTANFHNEYEAAPSSNAFRSALSVLEAQAAYSEAPRPRVHCRLGFEGDPYQPSRILIDLANEAGELVDISSQGWQVTGNMRSAFLQSATALPLPRPERPKSGSPIDQLANLFQWTDTVRTRALTWLAAAFRPIGPYPILVIRGRAGSGKSTLAEALRGLIDPASASVRRLRRSDSHNWVHVFDPVRQLDAKLAGDLCSIPRPVILLTAGDLTASELFYRAITIDLSPLAPCSEAALWTKVEAHRPALMAALADAVASALRRIHSVDIGNVARLHDCAAWVMAAAPALGLREESIVSMFEVGAGAKARKKTA
jgi:energy-coupling factor transporter ATP-binding protein EcfA2